MSGITVAEKTHWKESIAKRIDKRIEAIAAEEPNFFDRIEREARERALQSLGLLEIHHEIDRIEREKEALDKREEELRRRMLAVIRGVLLREVDPYSSRYHHAHEVPNAISVRQAAHKDELLAESELGRRVLALRQEKDDLLDVIWLATSPREIKTLWSKVGELLNDSPTQLQQEALKIEPNEAKPE